MLYPALGEQWDMRVGDKGIFQQLSS